MHSSCWNFKITHLERVKGVSQQRNLTRDVQSKLGPIVTSLTVFVFQFSPLSLQCLFFYSVSWPASLSSSLSVVFYDSDVWDVIKHVFFKSKEHK